MACSHHSNSVRSAISSSKGSEADVDLVQLLGPILTCVGGEGEE
jgi:hypothetical protein